MLGRVSFIAAALVFAAGAAHAQQSIADFYKGRTVNVLIGVGVGGEYDLQARLVAKHIGKHIPGNPSVVPQNMTGAGGLKMANYLFLQAAKDGTYIGMMGNNFPATQAVGGNGVQFDARKFRWLGTIAPVVETMTVWHTSGVTDVEGAKKKEVIAGATGRGAITYFYPAMMNELLGTKFKIVTGYPGGNQINLAMERGEVEARNNTWSSWKSTRPDWIKEKKITVLVQAGPRAPDLDAPSVESLAKTPDDKLLIELITSGTQMGRPLALTPDVPQERADALRKAFLDTMKDPDFLKEAAQANFEVDPVSGEALQKVVEKVLATPQAVAVRGKEFISE